MTDDRQGRALAQLLQLKRLDAHSRQREAQAARAQALETGRHIAGLDGRVAAEAGVLSDYADAPALGRWLDLMDANRTALAHRQAGEERQAAALAQRAAEADRIAEQHKEVLAQHRRSQAETRRRAAERAEWEALAALYAKPRREW